MINSRSYRISDVAYGLFAVVALMTLVSCDASGSKSDATNQPAATKPSVEAEADSTVSIMVKWKDFGDGMTYEVYRGVAADFEPNYNSLVSPPGLSKTTFGDDNLTPATTYFYKVYCRKINSTGPATHIGDISAKTPANDPPLK